MPLPAGSNWPWAQFLLQLLVFSTAIGWWLSSRKERNDLAPAIRHARPVVILMTFWVLWLLLQIVPLPLSVAEVIAPHATALALKAAHILGQERHYFTISVDPWLSFEKIMQSLSLLVFMLLALVLLGSRQRVKLTMWVIVYAALFQAVFGSLMVLSGVDYHLFGPKQHSLDVATGTFVNRNHLAGFLSMSLAIGIGLLLSQMKYRPNRTLRQLMRDWFGVMLDKKMQLRIMLAIVVIALVLTRSRMGNSAFFTSLLICAFIWIFLSGRRLRPAILILFASLILVDMYIVGTWFGFEKVVERLEQTSVATEIRIDVATHLLGAIADFGLTGSGSGTFRVVYPSYKDPQISNSFLYAHNDYLQFILETGWAFIFLCLLVLMSLYSAFQAMRTRKDPLARGLGFASLMGMLGMLIHSAVDFNLQIPANSMLFVLLISFAWIGRYGLRARN